MASEARSYDKIVYLLQGGGALGAYQAGVCQALLEHQCEPDWVVGTSIGAINASIIAGNEPQDRIAKLKEFWNMVTVPVPEFIGPENNMLVLQSFNYWVAQWILMYGVPHFFKPKYITPSLFINNTPDKISFYDTTELRTTLEKVVNFKLINQKRVRLTLGAVRIRGGLDVHFDNTKQIIGPEHIMASSALPPGFPAIKIDGEYYWDGGVSSNTPFSVLLEEKISQKLLCFLVNLFTRPEYIPTSLMDIYKYKKEIEFASRHQEVLHYFYELHYLKHAIDILSKTVHDPNIEKMLKKIAQYRHPTSLNIVRFHYRDPASSLWSKDFNFASVAINDHWQHGYNDVQKAFKFSTWLNEMVDESGALVHEF